MIIISFLTGVLALIFYIAGATGFLGISRGTGAIMGIFCLGLSIIFVIAGMFRADRLHKTHDLP